MTNDTSDTQGNSYSVSLYGTTDYLNRGYVDGFISGGLTTFDSERTQFVAGGDVRNATAEPSAFFLSGAIETGATYEAEQFKFGPFAGVKMAYVDVGSYDEEGAGALNLDVDSHSDLSAVGRFGLAVRGAFQWVTLVSLFRLSGTAFNHEFGDAQTKSRRACNRRQTRRFQPMVQTRSYLVESQPFCLRTVDEQLVVPCRI